MSSVSGEEQQPVPMNLMIPHQAAVRLRMFADEAGVPADEIVRFALAQFLAWQDGVATLILRGQHHQQEEG